jgi:glycosyltransferase involved in cell wall biosynthesis
MIDITFIVTTYNAANYVEETLLSVINQKKSGLTTELIVIDDGSIDETKNILLKYKLNADIYIQENNGVENASNHGINSAKGRYICRIDSDDILSENFLVDVEPYLEDNNYFYYGNYCEIDSEGKTISNITLPNFSLNEILERGDFLASGTIFPKNLVDFYGRYNEEKKNCGLENYELVLKMILDGKEGIHIPKSLFFYRVHDESISTKKRGEIIEYGNSLMKKLGKKYITNEFHPALGRHK